MKNILILLVFVAVCFSAHSQDIIVTHEGDTIECKITRVERDYIHFSVYDKSGILLMRSRLPISAISNYIQNSSEEDFSEEVFIREEDRVSFDEISPSIFRFSLNTGLTYQVEGYENLPDSYRNQLQFLWYFGGDIYFFPHDNFGLGFKYNRIQTSANEEFEPPYSTAFGFSKIEDEKVTFDYVAVSLLYRKFLYDEQVLNYFISAGNVMYRTDGFADGAPFYQDGQTLGIAFGVSYDFIFVQHMGMGFGIEANIARLGEFDNNGTIVPADFGISRIDFTIGFRLY